MPAWKLSTYVLGRKPDAVQQSTGKLIITYLNLSEMTMLIPVG
jgi:hypothetical protein